MKQTTVDPRVGVSRPARLPELEGLTVGAQWALIRLAHEKHKAGRAGSRAARIAAIFLVWILGLGAMIEVCASSRDPWPAIVASLLILGATALLAWAISAWMRRLWLRMKVAELRESRGCYGCDYPLPAEDPEAACPECGLANDLRERTWWRAEVTT